ncbi:MAG: Rossmann-like and DUF2520 domain-containing protein [Actinomycetota bacterium]
MLDLTSARLKVALFGAGRVGTAVAALLGRAGHDVVGVASRTPASAHRAAERLGCPTFTFESLPPADVLLIGVVDGAIPEVATALTDRVRGGVAVHFAGSLGLGPLVPLIEAGASGAALHPVQACPDVDSAIRRLPGSVWGVTCSDRLSDWARELISRDLEGLPVDVAEQHRALWHAAAVVSSNGIAALLAFGERILETIGIEEPERVLGPLAEGVVANAAAGGGGGATLTGPAVRGDHETIARHLRAFEEGPTGMTSAYARVTQLIVEEARAADRIDGRVAQEMHALLERR